MSQRGKGEQILGDGPGPRDHASLHITVFSRAIEGRARVVGKAHTLDHAAIARLVQARWPDVGAWWAQTVTVSYERIRGLRQKGQLCTGEWSASKSKTFPVPVEELFASFVEAAEAGEWLGAAVPLRAVRPSKSVRFTWPDGSEVSAWFTDKGAKSSVAIQHSRLPDEAARTSAKAAWGERLKALAEGL